MLLSGYGTARAFVRRGRPLPVPGGDADQAASLLCVPLFHTTGLHSGLTNHTAAGNRLVMIHKWDLADAAAALMRESEWCASRASSWACS